MTLPSSLLLVVIAMTSSLHGAIYPPLQPGQAVVTTFSDNNPANEVFRVVDIRNPAANGAVAGTDWTTVPMEYSNPTWKRTALMPDEVFGIALDDASQPNIYLTSTVVYQSTFPFPTAQLPGSSSGRVFKVGGGNGNRIILRTLPNGGQGLGNIAWDPVNDQLIITNFSDGVLYAIDPNTGATKSTFDPFTSPSPTNAQGFANLGERLWGVGVFRNRVYFAVWSRDQKPGNDNTIWSVALDSNGAFVQGAPKLEVTLNASTAGPMPVSDIEFSQTGRMLLAQHGMDSTAADIDARPHLSRVLEYVLNGTAWGRRGARSTSATTRRRGTPRAASTTPVRS